MSLATGAFTPFADRVPVISFDGVPSSTEHQALKISFRASDDYGVTGARLVLTPHGRPGAPLDVDLPLAPGKSVTQTNFADETGHPYAGLLVDGHLEARDGAGQIGKSSIVTFRLPARVFTDPLARALIEQRQNLGHQRCRRTQAGGHRAGCPGRRARQILCRQARPLYGTARRLLGAAQRRAVRRT